MKPNWQKLANLAQEICTLKFQFFGAVFGSKGYPFKNILYTNWFFKKQSIKTISCTWFCKATSNWIWSKFTTVQYTVGNSLTSLITSHLVRWPAILCSLFSSNNSIWSCRSTYEWGWPYSKFSYGGAQCWLYSWELCYTVPLVPRFKKILTVYPTICLPELNFEYSFPLN